VGVIQATGLTETQLEAKIREVLSPNILKEPSVTAAMVSSQQRAFSVLGDGVPLPGRYFLPRYDFRLTDALATAGSPRQFNVSYIYVSRVLKDDRTGPGPMNPGYGELELKVIEP
jgi:protein involved in polysaccharide export with SLBB domain